MDAKKTKTEPVIITCGCGQENQLVKVKDVWCFDIQRHGNGEPFRGKCFNCPAEVKGPKGWTAPPVKGAKAAAGATEVDRECMKGLVAQMDRMERAMGKMESTVNGLTEEKNRLADENQELAEEKNRLADENQQLRADAQGGDEDAKPPKGKK